MVKLSQRLFLTFDFYSGFHFMTIKLLPSSFKPKSVKLIQRLFLTFDFYSGFHFMTTKLLPTSVFL